MLSSSSTAPVAAASSCTAAVYWTGERGDHSSGEASRALGTQHAVAPAGHLTVARPTVAPAAVA